MRRYAAFLSVMLLFGFLASCSGGAQRPEKWEVALSPPKGVETSAKGTAVIDTKTGTDVTLNITGLAPDKVYTVFFVNIGSKMFEGVGKEPYLLPVDANGTATMQTKIKKNAYEPFTKIGVFMNPGTTPLLNPVGVDTTLGPIVEFKTPKMVLEGKLR